MVCFSVVPYTICYWCHFDNKYIITVFEIQKALKTKKLIEDPSLAGKQQENEPGGTGYFHVLLNNCDQNYLVDCTLLIIFSTSTDLLTALRCTLGYLFLKTLNI